ncbi:MAG: fructosamine kinase family protein [Lachnospiraceae bacterium]|nr:fructosamine kinase family protein [Lachnospiraceae bacterium]
MSVSKSNSIEEGIKSYFGDSVTILDFINVSGGDINEAQCIRLSNGERIFVKKNSIKNEKFFIAEEIGLNAIAQTGTINVPKLLFRGADTSKGHTFLAMEYLAGGRRIDEFWEEFGQSLAKMHRASTEQFVSAGKYGFDTDNYIGATNQINDPKDSWLDFFRECRLEHQFKMAEAYFDRSAIKKSLKLLDNLPKYLTEPAKPSLLHGDLWSGNYIVGDDGRAWLIDPAVYVGHAEADLAMTELFGRFPSAFYASYKATNPLEPGYEDRRDLYNLYHLLNHLNLFGGGYYSAVMETVKYYV